MEIILALINILSKSPGLVLGNISYVVKNPHTTVGRPAPGWFLSGNKSTQNGLKTVHSLETIKLLGQNIQNKLLGNDYFLI